jgi:hypothetical protein
MGLDHRGAHLAVTEQIKRWEKPNIPSHDSRVQLSVSQLGRRAQIDFRDSCFDAVSQFVFRLWNWGIKGYWSV